MELCSTTPTYINFVFAFNLVFKTLNFAQETFVSSMTSPQPQSQGKYQLSVIHYFPQNIKPITYGMLIGQPNEYDEANRRNFAFLPDEWRALCTPALVAAVCKLLWNLLSCLPREIVGALAQKDMLYCLNR